MPDGPRASILNTLGWGAYLACSWTWCIGMFLPVLLIRDFGWWAFPVFAIPNCLGAAAMGWVLRKPGSSEAVVAAHGRAIRAFSIVTTYFQIFFLYSLTDTTSFHWFANPTILGGLAGVLFGLLASRAGPWRIVGAFGSMATSFAIIVYFVARADTPVLSLLPERLDNLPGLAFLAPVCLFGFALSPYLDGTFLLAATNDGRGAVPARFAVGFLIFFPVMIVFTALYAGSMLNGAQPGTFGSAVPLLAATPVIAHIASQLLFTVGEHSSVISKGADPLKPERVTKAAQLALAGIGFAFILGGISSKFSDGFEIAYRLFMSFYGLVFPAYVWICMLPTLREPAKPTRPQLIACALAVALAAPFYYLGFIELKYWALAPGVMIPLVAGLIVRYRGRQMLAAA